MLEMRIRRLKWMQAVSKDTSNHIQLLCALFGRMKCENSDTVVEGKLTEYANPWARQIFDDIESLSCLDPGTALLEQLDGKLPLVFTEDHSEEFCDIDVSQLRTR